MYVKYIHDLCSLLGNILTYLIDYSWPRHIFHRIWGFSKQSSFIWFWHCEADFLVFCMFLTLRDLRTSNGPNFFATSLFGEIKYHEKKLAANATRDKRVPTMRSTFMVVWWGPSGALWVQLLQTLSLQNYLDLKPTIKGTPMRYCEGAAEKHEIHNMDLQNGRIGGETLLEQLELAPSPPSTPSPSASW
jgi:hypothetical protein